MDNGWLRPGEFREVVQIGAVKLDAETLQTIGEFAALVRPRINKGLSAYFEALTGITNATLQARGIDFRDAYDGFVAFAGEGPIISFGRDDRVLVQNLSLYGIRDAPLLPVHINIAPWLNQNGIVTEGLHACDIARACGAEFHGLEHDALEDARSITAGACALIARGAHNVFLDKHA
jgi:inhibitor of KinA sporulation pathway (predicted exonuclease)